MPVLIPENWYSFIPAEKELLSVFTKFQPGDTMDWFEQRNVPLKIENDNRVFRKAILRRRSSILFYMKFSRKMLK
jgi:predicted flavoprotein YhiN